jgi:5-methylcytosine-specific restriction enzyme A
MARWPYGTRAWRAIRLVVLRRDRWTCQLRYPGCRTVARSVDHIVRPQDGGAPFDLANLRAACVSCNTYKRNLESPRTRRNDRRPR